MSRLTEAKNKVRELSNKALQIADDPRMDLKRKHAALDQLEPEIKHWSDEVRSWSEVAVKRGAFLRAGDPELYGFAGQPVTLPGDADGGLSQAPSLVLEPDQQQALFKSCVDRMPFITKATVSSSTVDPALYPAQFLPPVLAAREPTRILDLLPITATGAALIEYYVTTGSAAAAPVAEGAPKPESGIAFTKAQAKMSKIAHWMQVTEEALSDFAPFAQLLSADMIAGVIDAENNELLNGTATGASGFKGLLKVAGTGSYTRVTGDTILDALEIGMTGLRSGGRFTEADGVVLHPLDYSKARRTKSTTNEYIAGDPTQAGPATLWGKRVVLTSEMPQGKALVANFAQAAQVWVRDGITVRTNANGIGFRTNTVEVLAEERLTLGVVAPSALSVVTIADPA